MSVEERRWVSLIEQRRSLLLGSDSSIATVDYGAGSPDANRTKAEMAKGVPSTALVSDVTKASKPAFWATVLFKLIRKLGPSSCVELGSCVGISASYQAAALQVNGKGHLNTLEGSPQVAAIAQETLALLKLQNAAVVTGPFRQTLKVVLDSSKPVDFFFNDGHHDHDAVMEYFNEALPYLSKEAVLVVDDISWSPGMRRAWSEIADDARVMASIDLQVIGIALMGSGLSPKATFMIRLEALAP